MNGASSWKDAKQQNEYYIQHLYVELFDSAYALKRLTEKNILVCKVYVITNILISNFNWITFFSQ